MADFLLSLIIILFIINYYSFIITLTNANPRIDPITRGCANTKPENTSEFLMNYWEANVQVETEILDKKFAFGASGKPPNRVYVMAECYDDLSIEDCNICFTHCRNYIPTCIPRAGGQIFLDGCFMRASNYNFYQETLKTKDVLRCGSSYNTRISFTRLTENAVNTLVKKTVANGGFAELSEVTSEAQVYTLGICWKTLDMNSCMSCIASAASIILSCLPATEGRALKSGCVLRYSDYSFVNKFRLPPSLNNMVVAFVGLVFGTTAAALLAICIGVLVGKVIYKTKNDHNKFKGMIGDSSLFKRSLRFKYSTIDKATEHFSETNKLGEGGFGEVYKGCLGDGREIAVKRLFFGGNNQSQEFYNEMNIISQAQHKNLVRFLGCSVNGKDNLIVYEFLPNKSLNLILFDPEKKKELDWKKRVGIISGTAEGLHYLHNDCRIVVVHRDIKASNILLDHRFRPKIADFGLARFCSGDITVHPIGTGGIAIAGTLGYMAPEYISRGQLTEKVDVYSYGVLVLEIVSGVQNSKFNPDESLQTLVTSAWKHLQSNTVSEIVDESLEVENIYEEVKRIVQVGLLCTQETPSLRPTMRDVIQMLRQKDLHLPNPSKPPFFDESTTSLEINSSSSRYSDAFGDQQQPLSSSIINNSLSSSSSSSSCNINKPSSNTTTSHSTHHYNR